MLIDLNNISIDKLKINNYIIQLFEKYSITNYEELQNQIKNGNEYFSKNIFLCTALNDALSMLNKQGDHKHLLPLAERELEKKASILEQIDNSVKACDLPLFVGNPLLIYAIFHGSIGHSCNDKLRAEEMRRYSDVFKKSMLILKDKVSQEFIDKKKGTTKPYLIVCGDGIAEEKYARILASIDFYDKYIEVLLKNYSNIEDPFYYRQQEKLNIVRQNKLEIFKYLFANGYQFAWGTLSETAKENMLLTIESESFAKKKVQGIQNAIANYITVDESCDITSPKVLNRFIVPFGKS